MSPALALAPPAITPQRKARKARKRSRGFGELYQRGQWWYLRWRENGQRRIKKFPNKDLAERTMALIAAARARGESGLGPDRSTTPALGELFKDWIERREHTHRSAGDDRGRWHNHLAGYLQHLRPDDVDTALLRKIIEEKMAGGRLHVRGKKRGERAEGKGLSSTTARLLMRLCSTFFSDLVERGIATKNPVKALPRATRRLIRPSHDPRTTPFIEKADDIRRVYLALPEPVNVAFAIGALCALRTGETLALKWAHVDIANRRIHVRESVGGPLKDEESRLVPIQDGLLPILKAWHLRTGGQGLVVPPMRPGRRHCDEHTLGKMLRAALVQLGLPPLTWYQATRHTGASQWVLAGGTIEKLREIMGHSTVIVTERYAHLKDDCFTAQDLSRMQVDLSAPAGQLVALEPPRTLPAGCPQTLQARGAFTV